MTRQSNHRTRLCTRATKMAAHALLTALRLNTILPSRYLKSLQVVMAAGAAEHTNRSLHVHLPPGHHVRPIYQEYWQYPGARTTPWYAVEIPLNPRAFHPHHTTQDDSWRAFLCDLPRLRTNVLLQDERKWKDRVSQLQEREDVDSAYCGEIGHDILDTIGPGAATHY